LELAAKDTGRYLVIDATLDEKELASAISERVLPLVPLKPASAVKTKVRVRASV